MKIKGIRVFFVLSLVLLWNIPAQALTVVRGPYLQMGSADSVVVRWRTDEAVQSRVQWGNTAGNYTNSAQNLALTTEHELKISGLNPNTRYFYSVGTPSEVLAGDDTYFFVTSPVIGQSKPTRMWILGDQGTVVQEALDVRDQYFAYTGSRFTDLWLMLGDNAYQEGTDNQYQQAVFEKLPVILRQSVLWPTMGNHDGISAQSETQSGPYYDIFSLPKNGESGGIPSGTEAYYSFDYGNIHFICLDSHDTDRSPLGPMARWLVEDLDNTTQDWIIAFWHHPPYTKGSHDSDNEIRLIEMRENFVPILEARGVDLVLTGHSHSYERSFLINGHHDNSSTLQPSMIIDSGNGRENEGGGYQKDNVPNAGAIYAVSGSAGKITDFKGRHPIMLENYKEFGSMIIDIDGDRMDSYFLNKDGVIKDHFMLFKNLSGEDLGPPLISAHPVSRTVQAGDMVQFEVTAVGELPLSYQWQINGNDIPGANSAKLTIGTALLTDDGARFRCVVSNAKGSVTSQEAVMTVISVPPGAANPPVAENINLTISQNEVTSIVLLATDPDGDSLTYRIISAPQNGTLSGTPPNLNYSPLSGFFGEDQFTFVANDGFSDSNVAMVKILVNSSPMAGQDNFEPFKNVLTPSSREPLRVTYSLSREQFVKIRVLSRTGEEVRVLISETKPAGPHVVTWDGSNGSGSKVGSGFYTVHMEIDGQNKTQKVMIIN